VRQRRFEDVYHYVAERMLQGAVVYSPIAHSNPITERFKLPVDWNFWQHFDRAIIQKSDGLEVLMLPGWRRSVGVTAEINFARGLPIAFKEFVVKAVHNASAAMPPSFRAYPE
jgi:uncharacterized protein DUF1937